MLILKRTHERELRKQKELFESILDRYLVQLHDMLTQVNILISKAENLPLTDQPEKWEGDGWKRLGEPSSGSHSDGPGIYPDNL